MNNKRGNLLYNVKFINLTLVVVSNFGMEFKASWYDMNEAYTGNKKKNTNLFSFCVLFEMFCQLMIPIV
jgi:hypothetical protein